MMIIFEGRFVYRRVPCGLWSLARVACSCGAVPLCCRRRTSQHMPSRTPRSVRLMLGRVR